MGGGWEVEGYGGGGGVGWEVEGKGVGVGWGWRWKDKGIGVEWEVRSDFQQSPHLSRLSTDLSGK